MLEEDHPNALGSCWNHAMEMRGLYFRGQDDLIDDDNYGEAELFVRSYVQQYQTIEELGKKSPSLMSCLKVPKNIFLY